MINNERNIVTNAETTDMTFEEKNNIIRILKWNKRNLMDSCKLIILD